MLHILTSFRGYASKAARPGPDSIVDMQVSAVVVVFYDSERNYKLRNLCAGDFCQTA